MVSCYLLFFLFFAPIILIDLRPKYQIQSSVMTIVCVGELMTEKLEGVSILSSAQEASMKISDNKISSLVVFDKDNHKPIGIVTERDLVRRVCASGIGSGDITIKDVMSASSLVTIDWRSSIEVAADMMIQNKVRHLIVINES